MKYLNSFYVLIFSLYGHPLLFAVSYVQFSQIRGVAPRIKIHGSDPSTDRNIKSSVTRRDPRVTPHDVQGAEGRKEVAFHRNVSAKNSKKKVKYFGGGGGEGGRRF
jgi:hypothetical protein